VAARRPGAVGVNLSPGAAWPRSRRQSRRRYSRSSASRPRLAARRGPPRRRRRIGVGHPPAAACLRDRPRDVKRRAGSPPAGAPASVIVPSPARQGRGRRRAGLSVLSHGNGKLTFPIPAGHRPLPLPPHLTETGSRNWNREGKEILIPGMSPGVAGSSPWDGYIMGNIRSSICFTEVV